MKYKFLKFSVFIALITIIFNACKKDDDQTPDNPLNGKTTAVFNNSVNYGTMTDQDGNVYRTVTIGTQTWMAENLRTTKYNDGTNIPNVTDSIEWSNLTTGAYCNYLNTIDLEKIATYGRLYNWYAVNTEKLAPIGWHVPNDDEWLTLVTYLGGENVAGGKLKETGTMHWYSPNNGASNETGFTSISGGVRTSIYEVFVGLSYYGCWWSATELDSRRAFGREMDHYTSHLDYSLYYKDNGVSVRCLRD